MMMPGQSQCPLLAQADMPETHSMSLLGVKRTCHLRCKCLLMAQSGHSGRSTTGFATRTQPLSWCQFESLRCLVRSLGEAMRRRDKRGKAVRTRRRKASKRRSTPKAARRRSSLTASKKTNVAELIRERDEALEQQKATSEVLSVISSSSGELEPVFEVMLANAARICEAKFAILYLLEGSTFRAVAATHDAPPAYVEARKRDRAISPAPDAPLGRVASTNQVVHIADLSELQSYAKRHPFVVAAVELGRFRTGLGVPLLKDNELVGSLNIFRQEVRPFTDKQIELVKNFAAQAVIAIENARLLSQLRESLQHQTATADVLKVITSSAGVLQPVFKTMLAKAIELCGASFGAMWLVDGEGYRTAAMHGDLPQAYVEQWRSGTLHLPKTELPLVHAVRSRKTVHTPDMREEKAYLEGDPLAVSAADIAGIRTLVTVPMIKEGEAVGAITIYRREVLPFTEKQIELVENFAAQAVIAIENARLLNELRESLQQQTATADVLKVIAGSSGELAPVFQAILENAVRICGAKFGTLFLCEGDDFRAVAEHNTPSALGELRRRNPVVRGGPAVRRSRETKQVVQVADITADRAYLERDPARVALVELGGYRAILSVPMLKDDKVIGAINIYRQEAGLFIDKQIDLVRNFASQAVIAIENTRLLNELRESLQQQTATSEVLKIISSTPGELEPVFNAMLTNATHLCEAKLGHLFLREGYIFRAVAIYSKDSHIDLRRNPVMDVRDNPDTPIDLLFKTKEVVQITDLRNDQSYIRRNNRIVPLVEIG